MLLAPLTGSTREWQEHNAKQEKLRKQLVVATRALEQLQHGKEAGVQATEGDHDDDVATEVKADPVAAAGAVDSVARMSNTQTAATRPSSTTLAATSQAKAPTKAPTRRTPRRRSRRSTPRQSTRGGGAHSSARPKPAR